MPVTFLALLVFAVVMAAGLMVWAFNAWGALTVLAILLFLALAARWALAHVPHDDGQT